MRVSELVDRTGVPLATVKYYLREGLLMPGQATSATRSVYDESHVRRLGLIKALSGIGLPINRIKVIVEVIEDPGPSLFAALAEAVSALPPYSEPSTTDSVGYPRAEAALRQLGQTCDPENPAVAQLDRALAAAEAAGVPMTDERLAAYAPHIMGLATVDIDSMPRESAAAAIEYAVVGTVVYEPVIAALRRIAHSELAAEVEVDATDAGR